MKILTASKIAKAYNKAKRNLIAIESGCGCIGTEKRWSVANEMVVLRQMLQALGFSNVEIDRHLHDI